MLCFHYTASISTFSLLLTALVMLSVMLVVSLSPPLTSIFVAASPLLTLCISLRLQLFWSVSTILIPLLFSSSLTLPHLLFSFSQQLPLLVVLFVQPFLSLDALVLSELARPSLLLQLLFLLPLHSCSLSGLRLTCSGLWRCGREVSGFLDLQVYRRRQAWGPIESWCFHSWPT